MEIGLVRSVDIDREMQQAYLDYAMSVIVARALPDARDGLKPVHRRILYAMYDMGMRPDSGYKKSARIVGEVLGKYHPHGDMAVYDAMARMAQPFSMRYLLVDGQGNFGSVDGDPPAAMRYTEARLAPPAMNILADIQKNTVDFSENFDGSLAEPIVLPAALPNLLVNGATGIAVGMSTSIPPHNLGEVIDALTYMLERWESQDDITVEDLMRFIQGPDFPTGGLIFQPAGEEGLTSAYGSGRGRVVVQARAHIEEMERGRNRIIVTELPYMTNKSTLIERIAELVREERLDGIADLRDESDRQGLRIVIELNKAANPQNVLKELYSRTSMRSTFGIIMLALVDGEPRLLSLKQSLRVYLEHRLVVIKRRSQYDLEKARQRAHILEGLRVALKNLDEIIAMIRRAPDADTARNRLMRRFKLTEVQAQAILDMALRRLAALERKKIDEEYKETVALIKELEGLLRSPKKMRLVAAEELKDVKDAYADRRRTQIVKLAPGDAGSGSHLLGDLAQRKVWVSLSVDGHVSRSLDENPPRAAGRDAPMGLISANTRDTLYLVTEHGEAAALPVHALPETDNPSLGSPAWKISVLAENERPAALLALPPRQERPQGWFVLAVTRQGMVKKTTVEEVPGPASRTFPLVKVNEGDRLGWIRLTDGRSQVLMVTAAGMAIRFTEEDIRPMGLAAAGVGGIKLKAGDEVAGMEILKPKGDILLVTSDGKAKRVAAAQFPTQGRYGQGVVAWKQPRTGRVVGIAAGIASTRVTVHLEKLVARTIRFDEVPRQTRAALGKRIIELKAGDRLNAITLAWDIAGALGVEEPISPARRSRSRAATAKQTAPAKPAKELANKATPANRRRSAPVKSAPADNVTSARTGSARKTRAASANTTPVPKQPATRSGAVRKSKAATAKSSMPQKPAAEVKPAAASRSSQKTAQEPGEKTTRVRKGRTARSKPKTEAAQEVKTTTTRKPRESAKKPPAGKSTQASGRKGARTSAKPTGKPGNKTVAAGSEEVEQGKSANNPKARRSSTASATRKKTRPS